MIGPGRPCRDRHPRPEETAAACPACDIFVRRADFRRLWQPYEDTRPGLPPTEPPTICAHRGDDLTVQKKEQLGLALHKSYAPCAKGHGQDGHIAPCEGCNPTCKDYTPSDPD